MNEFTPNRDPKQAYVNDGVGGKTGPSSCPTHGGADGGQSDEPPLSNRLISIRASSKLESQDTGGAIQMYPSMLVRKRERSEREVAYYDMLARFGKQGRENASGRGKIDHFSNASRFRMLKKLGELGREDPPFMVTLTYRSGSVTLRDAKKDLLKWRSRMDRQFGIRHESSEPYIRKDGLPGIRKRYKYEAKWAGSWRFEITTGRGTRAKGATPHFHILVWCDEWHGMDYKELDFIMSEMWCEVTGDGGPDRMKYGCRIDQSGGDQTKIKNYMLGHHGKKTDQEVMNGGRHWGMMNEELLQVGKPKAVYNLNPTQRHRLDRILAKLIAVRRGRDKRDLSRCSDIHTVIGPHEAYRLIEYLKVYENPF